jgi:3-oxoadipate enol-lactonase
MYDIKTITVGDMKVQLSGSGSPLVLLHGFTTTAEFWRPQVQAFSDSYRVIRPNLPGHGISPCPAERAYTIDAFVADLETLFEQLALHDAVLVGMSMGGVIAQQFALKHPELLRALVLVDTTSHGLGPDVQAKNVLAAIDKLGIAAASKKVLRSSFGTRTPEALVEWAELQVVQTPEFVAREAVASLSAFDAREQLEHIAVPTLVIAGKEDTIMPPEQSLELHRRIPNSALALIEQAAHFPMLEQSDAFARALKNFLDFHALPNVVN